MVAHGASDITENFLESIEGKTNTYNSNQPHRQAVISKWLAITLPITWKPRAKPKLKVPKVSTGDGNIILMLGLCANPA